MEQVAVSAVVVDSDKAKITVRKVPDQAGVAAHIFSSLAAAGIVVDIVIQNVSIDGTTDISFTLPRSSRPRTMDILCASTNQLFPADHLDFDDQIAKISVIGVGMRSHAIVAARMFALLAQQGINILLISTSEIKISCIIEHQHAERALGALQAGFGLDRTAA